jgi:hypothetical protein
MENPGAETEKPLSNAEAAAWETLKLDQFIHTTG